MTDVASTTDSPGETRIDARGDMRSRLVDAALAVLQRDGAAGLTVRAITTEAGCSTTGVYTYFGGKHGLVDAIFNQGFDSFDEAVGPGLRSGDLVEGGRAYRRWAFEHPTQYMVMFGSAVPDYEPSDDARVRSLESFQRLADGVARAGIAGRRGETVEQTAYHFFATVHGYVMLEMASMSSAVDVADDELYDGALRRLVES